MKLHRISSAAVAASSLAIMGAIATPANAFLLTNTSASWDNARLGNGKVVGQSATNANFDDYEQAAFDNRHDNYVEFIDRNGVSQVRWGDPAYNNYDSSKAQDGGHNYVWDYGYSINSSGSYQYGWHRDRTAQKSGLGFGGVTNKSIDVGQAFNIGSLLHYNNTIWGNDLIADKVDFSLDLGFAAAEIGTQSFNFSLNIDETRNDAGYHTDGVCPYQTDDGKGCSDSITWDFAVDETSTFSYEGEEYTLELVGFSPEAMDANNIVNQFISQESGTSEANLWAKIVRVPSAEEQIPEPAAILGLTTLGLYFAKSRRKKAVNEAAA